MKNARLEQIEDVYQAAVELPPGELSGFLDESCGGDDELRREVESLLRYENVESDFLDSPPAILAAEIIGEDDHKPMLGSEQFSHYRIERMLGEGGMGEVYLAEDTRLHRRVALKVLPQSIVGDAERLIRFEREAYAASALNHPNILTVHEFGEEGGVHFIASEFVDGLTLRQKLMFGTLDVGEALDVGIQVSSALSAAHDAGITHRDVKPENIMVRQDGYIKVLDFGLAKLAPIQTPVTHSGSEDPTIAMHRTKPGEVMGTAAYMSPEQARGRDVDARTDIWSLGVVIYEVLTGRRPFIGDTSADVMVAVLSTDPPPISSFLKELPPEVEWVVSKALSKEPEGRYQTAKELRTDLEKIRKRLDLDKELSQSANRDLGGEGGKEAENAYPTGKPAIQTAGNAARPTLGERVEPFSVRHLWSSGFAKALQSRETNWARSVAFVLAIVVLASSALYFFVFPRGGGHQIDSIAVLPFENLSGNPELNYVSEGLSESLIDRLSQLPQLKVISRSSSFKFRGADLDLNDIAKQLGVRAVVTGNVNQAGDDLNIRVDIIDTVENRHLAGGQYRRKAGDLLSIQNEVARTTFEQLRLKLTDSQAKRLTDNGTENSEAYRYYLNGLVELNGSQDVRGNALEYFERAVALDPDFAAAHAEIAWVYWSQANGSGDPGKLMPKAKAATERALALNPDLAKAHVVQAMVSEYEFDWQAAEREYRRAIELCPNLDFARNNFAFFLSVMGRQEEALAELEEQSLRDPINRRLALLQKGIILTQARQFDEALRTYQEAQAVEPARDIPNFALGYAYAGKGMYNEAAGYYKRSVELLGGEDKYSQPLLYLAATYARMPEKRNEARAILARIEAMSGYSSPALLAIVYSALDENDKAMELLEQAYIKRDLLLRFIGTGYEYDGLRGDPRFADLTRRIGIAQ